MKRNMTKIAFHIFFLPIINYFDLLRKKIIQVDFLRWMVMNLMNVYIVSCRVKNCFAFLFRLKSTAPSSFACFLNVKLVNMIIQYNFRVFLTLSNINGIWKQNINTEDIYNSNIILIFAGKLTMKPIFYANNWVIVIQKLILLHIYHLIIIWCERWTKGTRSPIVNTL